MTDSARSETGKKKIHAHAKLSKTKIVIESFGRNPKSTPIVLRTGILLERDFHGLRQL